MSFGSDRAYVVLIVSKKDFQAARMMLGKREKEIIQRSESRHEGASFANSSAFRLFLSDDPEPRKDPLKCILNPNNPIESLIEMTRIIKFLDDFVRQIKVSGLDIVIGENDIAAFRVASFISCYCSSKGKVVRIIDTTMNTIPPLFAPGLQSSSLRVLYSIIDFKFKNEKFPSFKALKQHHYVTVQRQVGESNILGEHKNRIWSSSEDSKFVASLYAAQRNLEKEDLLVKQTDGIHKITEISPTLNGFLSVIFSDVGLEFLEAYSS